MKDMCKHWQVPYRITIVIFITNLIIISSFTDFNIWTIKEDVIEDIKMKYSCQIAFETTVIFWQH